MSGVPTVLDDGTRQSAPERRTRLARREKDGNAICLPLDLMQLLSDYRTPRDFVCIFNMLMASIDQKKNEKKALSEREVQVHLPMAMSDEEEEESVPPASHPPASHVFNYFTRQYSRAFSEGLSRAVATAWQNMQNLDAPA